MNSVHFDALAIAALAVDAARRANPAMNCKVQYRVDFRFNRMTDGSMTLKADAGFGVPVRRIAKPAGSIEPYTSARFAGRI